MTAVEAGLQALERRHPEWKPWLAVIQEVLAETANPKWDAVVPGRSERQGSKIPLLADAIVRLDEPVVGRLLDQLLRIAGRSGSPKLASLEPARRAGFDPLTLFEASLCQQSDRLEQAAALLHADPEALQAIAALVPVPFLHACNRRWASLKSESWMEGYCPICGAWPTFAEVRGIERSRYFRCGRCAGEWQAHCLFCPYCGMTDHRELASLVPGKSGASGVIDACKRCLGYVKTFTTLQGTPPTRILLDDLATVDFDIAALEQGYRRPTGAGYQLNLTVTANGTRSVSWVIP
jgi:FdhE protein